MVQSRQEVVTLCLRLRTVGGLEGGRVSMLDFNPRDNWPDWGQFFVGLFSWIWPSVHRQTSKGENHQKVSNEGNTTINIEHVTVKVKRPVPAPPDNQTIELPTPINETCKNQINEPGDAPADVGPTSSDLGGEVPSLVQRYEKGLSEQRMKLSRRDGDGLHAEGQGIR